MMHHIHKVYSQTVVENNLVTTSADNKQPAPIHPLEQLDSSGDIVIVNGAKQSWKCIILEIFLSCYY